MILDDGWQSIADAEQSGRLTRFEANEKFDHRLLETTELAKNTYAIKTFLVWHAIHGYWGGAHTEALADYGTRSTLRWYSPEVLEHRPRFNWEWWGARVGCPQASQLERFYSDYYTWLTAQGVDGVKVDNQSSIEGLCVGAGGRVAMTAETRQALESSANRFFGANLLNCMSCSNDHIYHTQRSSLMRSSTDFWPNIPASHGLHVYTNAMVSLWFGQFIHPDWDMFQSGHPAGAYHAAARAVSGSAVYVSDKPNAQDFELLRSLVSSDGTILRATGIGLPTPDCLFDNPLEDSVLLKLYNTNPNGSAVVGLFNARYRKQDNLITGSLSPSDVPGLEGDRFVAFLQRAGRLEVLEPTQSTSVTLDTLEAEVVTLVPMRGAFTAIGLADKLNSGAAIMHESSPGQGRTIQIRDGGRFLAHAASPPLRCTLDGETLSFSYDQGRLEIDVPRGGPRELTITFG